MRAKPENDQGAIAPVPITHTVAQAPENLVNVEQVLWNLTDDISKRVYLDTVLILAFQALQVSSVSESKG